MLMLEGQSALALIFSPDGERLITGCNNGEVQIRQPTLPPTILSAHKRRISALAASRDGGLLATGSVEGAFRLWKCRGSSTPVDLGEGIRSLYGVTGLAFVGNDELLAVGTGDLTQDVSTPQGMFLWNIKSKKTQSIPIERSLTMSGTRCLTASVEHRLLVWGTDRGALVVWNMTKPDPLRFSLKQPPRSVALSPDGRLLAAAADWKITIFDLYEKRETITLSGHKGVVSSVAYSPDGRTLMTGSWDKSVRWWDAETGRELRTFHWPVGRISKTAYAPDGLRAAAAGDEGKIVVWDVDE